MRSMRETSIVFVLMFIPCILIVVSYVTCRKSRTHPCGILSPDNPKSDA